MASDFQMRKFIVIDLLILSHICLSLLSMGTFQVPLSNGM